VQNIDVIKDSDVLNTLNRPIRFEIGEGKLDRPNERKYIDRQQ
jgi:hypothetical protein